MVKTSRDINIERASLEAQRAYRPLICLPSDIGHLTPADLPFLDSNELTPVLREWDLIETDLVEARDVTWPIEGLRPGRGYAMLSDIAYGDTLMVFEARGADRCRELCGCNERGK